MANGDINAGVPKDFLVPDIRYAPRSRRHLCTDTHFKRPWVSIMQCLNITVLIFQQSKYLFPRHIIRRVVKDERGLSCNKY